jgi:hypothetical protein
MAGKSLLSLIPRSSRPVPNYQKNGLKGKMMVSCGPIFGHQQLTIHEKSIFRTINSALGLYFSASPQSIAAQYIAQPDRVLDVPGLFIITSILKRCRINPKI